jgi:CRP/FNR family transcriptional regulator
MSPWADQSGRLPQLRARPFDRSQDLPVSIRDLLSKKLQAKLLSIATVLEYARPGSVVFCEGEDAHFVYIVGAGIVRVSRLSPAGRRQVLALMFAGDIFGLPDAGLYVNSTEVIGPSTLYRIPWAPLSALMRREPEIQAALLTRIAFDYRQAQWRIMALAQQNAMQRLASFLLDLSQHPEFYDKRKSQIQIPLSRFDLGDYLGMARETLTRTFATMEKTKALKRKTPFLLEISDVGLLRRIALGPRRAPNRSGNSKSRN